MLSWQNFFWQWFSLGFSICDIDAFIMRQTSVKGVLWDDFYSNASFSVFFLLGDLSEIHSRFPTGRLSNNLKVTQFSAKESAGITVRVSLQFIALWPSWLQNDHWRSRLFFFGGKDGPVILFLMLFSRKSVRFKSFSARASTFSVFLDWESGPTSNHDGKISATQFEGPTNATRVEWKSGIELMIPK